MDNAAGAAVVNAVKKQQIDYLRILGKNAEIRAARTKRCPERNTLPVFRPAFGKQMFSHTDII